MSHTIVDTDQVEKRNGIFKPLTASLGVQAFGINQIELPPGGAGPEHDHAKDGHEEVYVVLDGGGTLRVDGEDVELRPGRLVAVTPESTRQLSAGEDGLTFVAVGAARR
ncbi:cupin domain-containing protein [soil metagenome]